MKIAKISKEVSNLIERISNSGIDITSNNDLNLIELQSDLQKLNKLIFKNEVNVMNPDNKLEAIIDSITEIGNFNFDNGEGGDSIDVIDDLDFVDQAVRMLKNSLGEKLNEILTISNATFALHDCFILTDPEGNIFTSFGSQKIIDPDTLAKFNSLPIKKLFNSYDIRRVFSIEYINTFAKHKITKSYIDNVKAKSVLRISIKPTSDGFLYKISGFSKELYKPDTLIETESYIKIDA